VPDQDPDHGVAALGVLAGFYRDGSLNPRPRLRVLHETDGAIHLDGDRGAGPGAPTRAMGWCIDRARQRAGMAVAAVRGWQLLVAAPYARLAAEAGLIGFACANFVPLVAPPGGRTAGRARHQSLRLRPPRPAPSPRWCWTSPRPPREPAACSLGSGHRAAASTATSRSLLQSHDRRWYASRFVSVHGHSHVAQRHRVDWYDDHMTTQMTATEVKAKILSLLDAVAAGEEIEITKHGRTVARLVPAKGPQALKGKLTGIAMSAAADEELFSTEAAWDLS
jgi:prevent-host-death family protein